MTRLRGAIGSHFLIFVTEEGGRYQTHAIDTDEPGELFAKIASTGEYTYPSADGSSITVRPVYVSICDVKQCGDFRWVPHLQFRERVAA